MYVIGMGNHMVTFYGNNCMNNRQLKCMSKLGAICLCKCKYSVIALECHVIPHLITVPEPLAIKLNESVQLQKHNNYHILVYVASGINGRYSSSLGWEQLGGL